MAKTDESFLIPACLSLKANTHLPWCFPVSSFCKYQWTNPQRNRPLSLCRLGRKGLETLLITPLIYSETAHFRLLTKICFRIHRCVTRHGCAFVIRYFVLLLHAAVLWQEILHMVTDLRRSRWKRVKKRAGRRMQHWFCTRRHPPVYLQHMHIPHSCRGAATVQLSSQGGRTSHTMSLEASGRVNALPTGCRRISFFFKLTVVILVDRHGGRLQNADFVPLMDPKCDFFWLCVRNLREGQKSAPRETTRGRKMCRVKALPCPGRWWVNLFLTGLC